MSRPLTLRWRTIGGLNLKAPSKMLCGQYTSGTCPAASSVTELGPCPSQVRFSGAENARASSSLPFNPLRGSCGTSSRTVASRHALFAYEPSLQNKMGGVVPSYSAEQRPEKGKLK